MSIPNHLKHKPVFVADHYAAIDGPYANNTDVQGLSLGLAQWNDRGNVDISAKVWRHTDKKWSRQSEELPLHRVLDLTLLICEVLKHMRESYRYEKLYDPAQTNIGNVDLQGDRLRVEVNTGNERIDEDIQLFRDCLSKEDELLGERLKLLATKLGEMGY
jgi:hypothetical protein